MADTVGLTSLQLAIMGVLWQQEEATTQETWEAVRSERPLASTTVATILARLERKGMVSHRREGRHHVYRAEVTRGEVRRSKVRDLTENLFGGDAVALLSHLVRREDVGTAELERMQALLDKARATADTAEG